jgi:chemotaxis protein MotA
MSAAGNKADKTAANIPGNISRRVKLDNFRAPIRTVDYGVWIGLSFLLIVLAIALTLSGSVAAFADLRAFLIVVCGTIAIIGLSFTGKTLRHSLRSLKQHLFEKPETPRARANNLMDVAIIARRDGILSFQKLQDRLRRQDPFLAHGIEMVSDGQSGAEVERILSQEIDVEVERLQGGIALLRRGAEAAPAMGLIGTLIGLVQMLSHLDDPSSIGPSMAIALLTTFYGALLGSAFFAPLAGKLELQAQNLILRMELVTAAMLSIVAQENPRRLEQILNSKLPPSERINYFNEV